MASYTVRVRFNSNRNKIRTNPESQKVAFGTDDVYWIQAGFSTQSWTFQSLTVDPTTAIVSQSITDRTMSVVDWNEAITVQTITYTIGINYNNTIVYSDPYILNDPQGG
jgi:hypothetical protein